MTRCDGQFEDGLTNLIAFWIDEQDDEGQSDWLLPEIMYRLGWIIGRGASNYGNLHNGEIADVLKNEAKQRGYDPPEELR